MCHIFAAALLIRSFERSLNAAQAPQKSVSVPRLSNFLPFVAAGKCGGEIELGTADYLTSPGYPGAYPPSQQCVWVITAPESGQKILINFNPHFDLEDRDCK